MSEDKMLELEGRIAALELICPMIAAHVIPKCSPIRLNLAELLETIAAGYDFPPHHPKAFIDSFTGCFDEIAGKIRTSP